MGLCFSDAATKAIMDKSHKVDHDMDMRKREAERRIKLLLLGERSPPARPQRPMQPALPTHRRVVPSARSGRPSALPTLPPSGARGRGAAAPPALRPGAVGTPSTCDALSLRPLARLKQAPFARAFPGPAGSGESGKSTIFKQMRILHGKGFSQDEREKMVEVIQQSIMAQMQVLVDMAEELDCSIADTKSAAAFGELDPSSYDSEAAEIVSSLWGDTGIQRAYELRSRFQLNDSAA